MPRTPLRRHDKYQARAGVLERRRRRKVLTAIIVIMDGDIAARRLWHKAGQAPLKSAGTSSETREWQAMQWAPIPVTPYRPAVGSSTRAGVRNWPTIMMFGCTVGFTFKGLTW